MGIGHMNEVDKKAWKKTTLPSLAACAKNKLESLKSEAEMFESGTPEYSNIMSKILEWARRVEILKTACQIK